MFKKFIDHIGKYGLRQKQLQAELEKLQKQNSRLVREKEWLAKMVWHGAGFDLRPLRELRGGHYCDECRHEHQCWKCWMIASESALFIMPDNQ